jgi:DNA-binding IclR family transcriptional regulator
MGAVKKHKGKSRTSSASGYSAPALEKGIEIVELLANAPGGLTISEIVTRLRRSMNEVFRIIVVMEAQNWLSKDPETDRYSVTYHLLELALRATPAQSLSTVAHPVMEKLTTETNQSCHLVVRAGGRGLVVQRQENASLQGGFALRPGASVDLVNSCSGHVLLAFGAPQLQGALARQFPRYERRLALVRRRGYEMLTSARTAGVTDISYPVFGFGGRLLAALTVPYLTLIDRSAPTTLAQTRSLLGVAARKLSQQLGYKPVTGR